MKRNKNTMAQPFICLLIELALFHFKNLLWWRFQLVFTYSRQIVPPSTFWYSMSSGTWCDCPHHIPPFQEWKRKKGIYFIGNSSAREVEHRKTMENQFRMTFGPHYHTSTCVLIQYSPWWRQFFINCICKSADIQGHEVHPRWIETCWRAVMPHGRSHRIMLSLHYQRVFFAPCFIGILNRYSKECRLWTPAWALWDRLALPSNLMRRACPRGQYRLFDSSIVWGGQYWLRMRHAVNIVGGLRHMRL